MMEQEAQLLTRLVNERGGKILVVGGEIKDLPRPYHNHPSLLLWDDNQRNLGSRVVPANVRAIIWNNFTSHPTVNHLNRVAKKIQAVRLPFLKPREIRAVLNGFVPCTEQVAAPVNPSTLEKPVNIKEMAVAVDASKAIISRLCTQGVIKSELVKTDNNAPRRVIQNTPDEVKIILKEQNYRPNIVARGKSRNSRGKSKPATELPANRGLFTVSDLATLTGRSDSHIYNYIKANNIETLQNGQKRYLLRAAAEQAFEALKLKVKEPEVVATAAMNTLEAGAVSLRLATLEQQVGKILEVVNKLAKAWA
jgi:hypothetical protein